MEIPEYQRQAIEMGHCYECGCGEMYKTAAAAWGCRKCRDYLTDDDYADRSVVDVRSGQVVLRDY